MRVDLIRVEQSSDGTFGVLLINGSAFCVTLEPEDRGNAVGISCIPPGRYTCDIVESPKWGHTYTLINVPGRRYIRIHPGNVEDDTQGCIILAQHFGKLRGKRAVLNSGITHKEFMRIMNNERFTLVITEVV